MTSNNKLMIIKNIFKSIISKNALVIIEEDYNEYSIENFILLIVHEALKKLDVDENIVQIVEKNQLLDEEFRMFDAVLKDENVVYSKQDSDKIYVYQEDEEFNKIVEDEISRLRVNGKKVELLKGDFEIAINKINQTNNYATSIYTKDRKKAYEFINIVNSKNVFFNSTLGNARETKKCEEIFFKIKNISCEYAFE